MEEKLNKKYQKKRRIIKAMWGFFFAFVAFAAVFFILVYNGIVGYMPPIEELKNPNDKFASIVYSADGKELGRYYRNSGNRVYADISEISPYVINALIATEDSRFEEHSGIDMRALLRVVFKTILMGNKGAGGGSTITQQLAKQLYSPESSGLFERAVQKPIEWVIAVKLERYYSKDEIIRMYLNQFDFLYNAVGIKSAAFVYFGKKPNELTIEEAAMLVGMVKNPSYYNPVRHPERTRERRNVVFDQMVKAGMMTEAEAAVNKEKPLKIEFHRVDHKDGLAPYFREYLRHILTAHKPKYSNYASWDKQHFIDDSIAWENNPLFGWVDKNPKPDGSKYDIYTDGLRIHTTIDSRMQQYAEEAVAEHMTQRLQPAFFREKKGIKYAPYTTNRRELPESQLLSIINRSMKHTDRWRMMKKAGKSDAEIIKAFNTPTEMKIFTYNGMEDQVRTPKDSLLYIKHFLRTGMMSMDSRSGHVKAYVGGPNFAQFQYDMVSTGRRQIGSTVKPFLYTYAMEEGHTPCDLLLNSQPVLKEGGTTWMPRNSGKARVGEMVDLKWALTHSNNWISARLMDELSPATLVQNMHSYGITNTIKPTLSIALGSCDVSVKEMVTAYSAFSNKGMRVDPVFVTRITDSSGNVITEFSAKHTEVISETAYYKILDMLLNVVNHGTGASLRSGAYGISAQMGGKTGTTNSNSDGWFMGFTPELVTGVWVGGEERFIHFNTMAYGQGAAMALPIYGKYMKRVYADKTLPYKQSAKFDIPEDLNLCGNSLYRHQSSAAAPESSIEGIFD